MASHLTFTPASTAAITTPKGTGVQAGVSADASVEGGIMGIFAALLGAASTQAATVTATAAASATTTAESSVDLSLGNLVNLSFGAGFGSEDGEEPEDPEAVAAVIDAILPIQTPIETKPTLTDLVDSLTELKQSLEAGEAVDPELLKRIYAALDELSAEFNIDLSALPSLDDLKTLVSAIPPDDTSVEVQLTTALAPLVEKLVSGSASAEIAASVELSTMVKSIGEKLGALLQSLSRDEIPPETLAALGLDVEADTAIDSDLEVAIAKLLNPPPKVDATVEAQVLAAPELKLTEPVLTGKPAPEAAVAATATVDAEVDLPEATLQVDAKISLDANADSDSNSDGGAGAKPDDKPQADAKVAATIAVTTAATDTSTLPDPQASAQPTQVTSRIDAAAARPVIQAGYQTSQQQLNLPQLAFELVRQVNDGNTRFQMRLDPPELGKIDVRLDIDSTGQVNARLTVERAETLDLMQRDQRGLEKALQQAGLDSAKTNLEFSLKQSPFSGGNQQGQDGNSRQPRFGNDVTAEADAAPPPTINLYRGSLTASGVNIIA